MTGDSDNDETSEYERRLQHFPAKNSFLRNFKKISLDVVHSAKVQVVPTKFATLFWSLRIQSPFCFQAVLSLNRNTLQSLVGIEEAFLKRFFLLLLT